VNQKQRLQLTLCSLGLSLALACGSDETRVAAVPPAGDGGAAGGGGLYTGGPTVSGSSKPKVTTDIPVDSLLSDLSASDAVELCKAVVKAADSGFDEKRSQRLNCYVFALSYATLDDGTLDENWCELEFEACVGMPKSARSPTCDEDSIEQQFKACDAAVGDLKACIEKSAEELRDLLDNLSCNEASYKAVDDYVYAPAPSECYLVAAACPNLDLSRSSNMGLTESPTGCDNNCPYARDGLCDDGGSGSKLKLCGRGTDCDDCGPR
jgi:hypothetical protein